MSEQLQLLTADQLHVLDDAPKIFVPDMPSHLEACLDVFRYPEGVRYLDRRGSDRVIPSIESQVLFLSGIIVDFASVTAYQSLESLVDPGTTQLRVAQLHLLAERAKPVMNDHLYWEENLYNNGRRNPLGRFTEWGVRRPLQVTFNKQLAANYPEEAHTDPATRKAVAESRAVRSSARELRHLVKQGLGFEIGQPAVHASLSSLDRRKPTPELLDVFSGRKEQNRWTGFIGHKPEATDTEPADDFLAPVENAFGDMDYYSAAKEDEIPF